MIRVTLEDEFVSQGNNYYIDKEDSKMLILVNTKGYENEYVNLSDVIRVEKQVKDLTKQEIYRYGELRYSEIASIRITEHNIVYAFYSEADEYYVYSETIDNDTYIDITDLIKEEIPND